MKPLSPPEAAYILGLIDGEGTITLTRKHPNENRQLAVSIGNTEKGLPDFVLPTAGVGTITGNRNCPTPISRLLGNSITEHDLIRVSLMSDDLPAR